MNPALIEESHKNLEQTPSNKLRKSSLSPNEALGSKETSAAIPEMLLDGAREEGQKVFDLYALESGDIEAVKRGFSWPGFFGGALWVFVKGHWLAGVLLLGVAFLFLRLLAAAASPGMLIVVSILYLALAFFVGVKGNAWSRDKLRARDYARKGTVAAATPQAAVAALRRAFADEARRGAPTEFYCTLCYGTFADETESLQHVSRTHGLRNTEARKHVYPRRSG